MYSIFKVRLFDAANRKRNLHRFGLLGRGRSLNFIDDAPGAESPIELTGTKDGVNVVFTAPNFAALYLNGRRLKEGLDYTVTPSTTAISQVTFTEAPLADDTIWGMVTDVASPYSSLRAESGKWEFVFTEIKDGVRVEFALPPIAALVGTIEVFRNGLRLRNGVGYTLSLVPSPKVTFVSPVEADDDICAILTP